MSRNPKESKKKTKAVFSFFKKILNIFKTRTEFVDKANNTKATMKSFYCFLRKLPKKVYFIFVAINFGVGLMILYYTDTIKQFFPHLVCLSVNISLTMQIGREYIDTLNFLNAETCAYTDENTELRTVFESFHAKAMHKANLLMCIIVVAVFLWSIFSQHYITTDLVGIYAVFMVCISVSFSVIGYTQYLWILWFLFRVSKCTSMHFNKITPANTPFLVKIATLLQQAKWCFLIEGFCYTFEYFILIPKENIISAKINMPDNFSFLLTWFIVLLVIVLAFPLIVFLQEYLLSQIVSNLKKQRIEYLSLQFDHLEQYVALENKPFNTFMYHEIISKLNDSSDYPLKIQRLGPTIVTIATGCLHVITLLTQLPELRNLFNQWGL